MRNAKVVGAGLTVLAMCLALGPAAMARGSVTVRDDASVLTPGDRQAITRAGANAPFDTVVWITASGYANNKNGFTSHADSLVGSDTVVVALDTGDKWSHVAARQNTGLNSSATMEAKSLTKSHFSENDWAGGIAAAITYLTAQPVGGGRAAGSYGSPMGGYGRTPAPSLSHQSPGGGGFLFLLIIIGILVFVATRFMGGMRRMGGYGPGMMGPGGIPGPMNQGGYGPGYGQPGGGIGGGLMAGGLGALGGGLLGYELGKSAGNQSNPGFGGNQGGFGGDSGGGFGADPGGIVESDSGAGNAPDFGGGADFGGGGADFGGGGTDF